MEIVRFKYDHGGEIMSIDLLLTGHDEKERPLGFQVWSDPDILYKWHVDDEPTIIVHPIVHRYRIATIGSVNA